MPKCNRCPIRRECNKMGKITLVKKDNSGEKIKICPLLWTISVLLEGVRSEASK